MHGEAGSDTAYRFPSLAIAFAATARSETRVPWRGRMLARIVAQTRHGVKKKDHNILG